MKINTFNKIYFQGSLEGFLNFLVCFFLIEFSKR